MPKLKILLTGGTGLIGQALCNYWSEIGHELIVLSRRPKQVKEICSGARGIASLCEISNEEPLDAIINLAGERISDKRWTLSRQEVLWDSRVLLTHQLVEWIASLPIKPKVMISASAIGWYGNRHEENLTESVLSNSNDFGSLLCRAWEDEANKVIQDNLRLVILRIAPVLTNQGGMLGQMLPVYKLGLGGAIGNGQQWMSWIHINDLIKLINFLLHNDEAQGIFNACAPNPVRNLEFTNTLSGLLHRPSFMKIPSWSLRLCLGELSSLMLNSQRVFPERALDYGFSFDYPYLSEALSNLVKNENG